VSVTSRVDRLLGGLGYGSRNEMARLAKAGGVVLDGLELNDASRRIAVTPDLPQRMTVDGEPLDPVPGLVLMLNKPLGMTCSHKEDGALVYDVLPDRWRRRYPAISTIGRLDKETSGLLLLTDDGDLLHRAISPKKHVPKVYRATLARPLTGTEAALFASGELLLENDDKPLKPAVLEVLSPTEARLTVTEGRYHIVRRMFAAVGNHVEALHRERFGALTIPADLEPGQWRLMTEAQVAAIFGAPEPDGGTA
jgi:16S rRNA pseudouridine516 synthase